MSKSNVRPTACMLHKTGSVSFYCQTKFTEVKLADFVYLK